MAETPIAATPPATPSALTPVAATSTPSVLINVNPPNDEVAKLRVEMAEFKARMDAQNASSVSLTGSQANAIGDTFKKEFNELKARVTTLEATNKKQATENKKQAAEILELKEDVSGLRSLLNFVCSTLHITDFELDYRRYAQKGVDAFNFKFQPQGTGFGVNAHAEFGHKDWSLDAGGSLNIEIMRGVPRLDHRGTATKETVAPLLQASVGGRAYVSSLSGTISGGLSGHGQLTLRPTDWLTAYAGITVNVGFGGTLDLTPLSKLGKGFVEDVKQYSRDVSPALKKSLETALETATEKFASDVPGALTSDFIDVLPAALSFFDGKTNIKDVLPDEALPKTSDAFNTWFRNISKSVPAGLKPELDALQTKVLDRLDQLSDDAQALFSNEGSKAGEKLHTERVNTSISGEAGLELKPQISRLWIDDPRETAFKLWLVGRVYGFVNVPMTGDAASGLRLSDYDISSQVHGVGGSLCLTARIPGTVADASACGGVEKVWTKGKDASDYSSLPPSWSFGGKLSFSPPR